jgi:hypothetical protein
VTQRLSELRSEDEQVRNDGAAFIWARYCNELLDLACRHLDQRLRRRLGEDDIVQRTFQSFFLRQQRGEFSLSDRNDLLRLLVRMTLNKTRTAMTRESRERRNYRREQCADPRDAAAAHGQAWLADLAAKGVPTPDEAVALAQETESRLAQLPADLRRIALLKLEGYTNPEIAALPEIQCTVRTVERKLRLVREHWGASE